MDTFQKLILYLILFNPCVKFQVFYTVDNPSKNWKGGSGYISKDMVVKGLPAPGDNTLILVSDTSASQNFALISGQIVYQTLPSVLYQL